MRLHDYPASGNCYKVRLLLALLERPYERVPVDLFDGDALTDAFGTLNPVRETPVLETDDHQVLTQSAAILWYLAEGTRLLPDTALDRARVLQWLSFEQERVMGGLGGPRFRLLTGRAQPDHPAVEARLAVGRGALDVLAAHLDDREWMVGETVSIADLALFPYISVAADAGVDPAGWPR